VLFNDALRDSSFSSLTLLCTTAGRLAPKGAPTRGAENGIEKATSKHIVKQRKDKSAQQEWEEMSENERYKFMLNSSANMFGGLTQLSAVGAKKLFFVTKNLSLMEEPLEASSPFNKRYLVLHTHSILLL
jgi:hypothetical protein